MDDHDQLDALGMFDTEKWTNDDFEFWGKLFYDNGVNSRTRSACHEAKCDLVTAGITRNSAQNSYSAWQRIDARSISRRRIRVENVIGIIKQRMKILTGVLPLAELAMMHKIFYICCMLHNFGGQRIF